MEYQTDCSEHYEHNTNVYIILQQRQQQQQQQTMVDGYPVNYGIKDCCEYFSLNINLYKDVII